MLTVKNADSERAVNKKANLNYRLVRQIEESKEEQKSHNDNMKAQDSRSKELSVETNRLNDAQSYLDLTLFTEADLDRCNEIIESGKEQEEEAARASSDNTSGSTEEFIDLI